jgi:acetyl esterase/lipase
VDRNLAFSKPGGKEVLLDLYRPEKAEGPLPVVVWIFGGAWMTGNKEAQAGTATWLAAKGYAVAAINYRLSGEAKFPAQVEDCKAAVAWLRLNAASYGLDGGRIGAWGASSGGHLATMLGVWGDSEYRRVQAVVDFFGPTDFLRMDGAALPGGMKHDTADSPESRLVGGPIQENKDKVARANPITYVTKEAAPILIVHGDRDLLVPVNQSELLFGALKQAGADATLYKIVGAGHGGAEFGTPMVRAMVLAFFDQHLKQR